MTAGRRLFGRLRADRRGATIIEFAIVAPVMLFFLMGMLELSYRLYLKSILEGAVQKAARDATIEGGGALGSALDQKVMDIILPVATRATFQPTRKKYSGYGDIAPEPYVDTNGNGQYDVGECFEDTNNNGAWNQDPGVGGQGSASDVVMYQMKVTYPTLFPVFASIGWGATQTIMAKTLLKNQPYDNQNVPTVAKCS